MTLFWTYCTFPPKESSEQPPRLGLQPQKAQKTSFLFTQCIRCFPQVGQSSWSLHHVLLLIALHHASVPDFLVMQHEHGIRNSDSLDLWRLDTGHSTLETGTEGKAAALQSSWDDWTINTPKNIDNCTDNTSFQVVFGAPLSCSRQNKLQSSPC